MSSSRLIFACLGLTLSAHAIYGREHPTGTTKPTIYNFLGAGSDAAEERQQIGAYRAKYKIVQLPERALANYVPPKSVSKILPRPQRDGGQLVSGKVRVVCIVTEQGRAADPFILRSTDARLNACVLDAIRRWHSSPARLNGSPIAVILHQDFIFTR